MLAAAHPAYVVLLVLHVVSAIVGFGAVAISGVYGSGVRHADARPQARKEARRYFASPGAAEWAILAVPVFGLAALALRPGPSQATSAWVPAALAVWIVAAVVLVVVVRPAEARVRALLADPENEHDALAKAGRSLARGAAVCDIAFVVALGLMIFRP
ncbi:MAG: DUF2269 family protein [Acidimicrobiaceae bacterium]|nr:DUF2269 family protein [Acidimicrobiaceae bacterium]